MSVVMGQFWADKFRTLIKQIRMWAEQQVYCTCKSMWPGAFRYSTLLGFPYEQVLVLADTEKCPDFCPSC